MSEPTQKETPASPVFDGATPVIDLGPDFEPLPFVHGRYAVHTERRQRGVHARDQLTLWSSASMVLELSGGSAAACIGQAFEHSVNGAHDRLETFRVQQGFQGSYQVSDDGEVRVRLAATEKDCQGIHEHRELRIDTIELRCVRVRALRHSALTEPVLLCEWRDIEQLTYSGLVGEGVAPGRWLLLGGGNGASVTVTGRLPSTDGAEVKAVVTTAAQRIERNTWDRPAPSPGADLEP